MAMDWSLLSAAPTGPYAMFGGGQFVLAGPRIYTSPDAVTWTQRFNPVGIDPDNTDDDQWTSCAYGAGVYVLLGNWGIAYSTDGATWALSASTGGNTFQAQDRCLAYGAGVFCWVKGPTGDGQRAVTSADGVTWTNQGDVLPFWPRHIAGSPALLMVLSGGGSCATSPDGVTWTELASTPFGVDRLTYDPDSGYFYALHATTGPTNFTVSRSVDGVAWETQDTGFNVDEFPSGDQCIRGGGGTLVVLHGTDSGAAGAGANSVDSANFTAWDRTDPLDVEPWSEVLYDGTRFVAIGFDNVAQGVPGDSGPTPPFWTNYVNTYEVA